MWINQYLAKQGLTTRRGADALVKAGKIFINGRRAIPTDQVTAGDRIELKGELKNNYLYYAYWKPLGVVTHSAARGDKEIKHIFPVKNVFPVGRLDKASHGLIILTNDGRVTDRLLNPKYNHDKEYEVRVNELVKGTHKKRLESGVNIEGYKTAPAKVVVTGLKSFRITLREGKKHQIRRMCAALGLTVQELKRVRILNIKLGSLKSGQYRPLIGEELKQFLHHLGL